MDVKALVFESDNRCLEFFRNVLDYRKAPLRVARDTGAQKCSVARQENGSGGNVEQGFRKTLPEPRGRE